MRWTEQNPFQALALTGGGYRGLFTARALQEIEEHIEAPIGSIFDITYGTSIGGIIALAVAFEVPMKKVVETFGKHGELIFPPREKPKGRFAKLFTAIDIIEHRSKPRYRSDALRQVITELIPEGATLNDVKYPVAVPAVNLTEGRPQVFKSRHKQEWSRDWKYKAVDVALATAAAPTFFPLAEVGGHSYADGGLFANAPDLLALHEAEFYFDVPLEAVRMLSIGTTTKSYSVSFSAGVDFGVFDWMANERLLSVIISSQQQMAIQLMKHKLRERYLRIDHEPSNEQTGDLGLDVASEAARKTLMALGSKEVTNVLGTSLQQFLTHVPQLKVVKDL